MVDKQRPCVAVQVSFRLRFSLESACSSWHSRGVRISQHLHRKKRSPRTIRRLYLLAITVPVLLILLPLTFYTLRKASQTQAAWFDTDWSYRKAVNIPSHTTLETNVYVTVPTFDATDTTRYQADCGDLRFTSETGQLLKYYVVDCDSTANIRVFFDSLPAGETNYYMYYGNPNALNGTQASNFSTAATGLGTLALGSESVGPGPVAVWGFDEGSGQAVSDSTENRNHGTLGANSTPSTDDPSWKTEEYCKTGKCLAFDGTADYVAVADGNSLDLTNTGTIQAWVKSNNTTAAESGFSAWTTITAPNGSASSDPSELDTAIVGNKLYYASYLHAGATETFQTANSNLDGSSLSSWTTQTAPDGAGTAETTSVAVDSDGVKLYYAAFAHNGAIEAFYTASSNLDGTGFSAWTTQTAPDGSGASDDNYIDMVLVGSKLYFVAYLHDDATATIQTASSNLDGTSFSGWTSQTLPTQTTGNAEATVIAIDSDGQKLYYAAYSHDVTSTEYFATASSNLDGTGFSAWTTQTAPDGAGSGDTSTIAMTLAGGKMYFAAYLHNNATPVFRTANANLNGTGFTAWTSQTEPGIAVTDRDTTSVSMVSDGKKLYYVALGHNDVGTEGLKVASSTITNQPIVSKLDAYELIQTGTGFVFDWAGSPKSFGTISDSSWTHVAVTWNGSQVNYYVNANLVRTDVVTTDTTSNSSGLKIGGEASFFLGSLDTVKIYPYARSASQLLLDYSPSGTTVGLDTANALSSGLIGYWKLDEASGNPVDSSGNAQTLTNANTTAFAVGKFANGADLERSSTNYFYVADNATLSVTGNLTLAAWIKPESVTAATTFTILGKWDGANESYRLVQYGDEISLSIDATAYAVTSPSSNLATGTWYHVAGTFDPGTRRMAVFVNGALVAESTAGPSSIGDSAEVFQLGGANHSSSGTDLYDGVIDDARVYNRTLSNHELEHLSQFGPPAIGSWNLNEGTGTTAYDQSSNGNDLTLTNTPAWGNGKAGGGITFAGSNQHLLIADDADFDFADDADMSISLFFKHTTASAQEILLSKYNEAGYKVIMESDGDITCAMDYDSTWSPTDTATSTAATYDDNQWHHVACVKSGATSMKLYIDGVLIAVDPTITATNTLTNSDPLYIGINADGTSNDFTGSIDEIKIYTYALTAAQVQADKNLGHPLGSSTTPNVYWAMDEEIGTSTYNSGAGTITGALSNARFTRTGKVNGAVYFDGSGDVLSASSAQAFDGQDGISFSFWLNPTSVSNSTLPTIYNRGNQSNSVGFHWIYFNSGGTLFQYQYANGSAPVQVTLGAPIVTGTWQHIVITHDRLTKTIKTYYNGRHVDTDTYTDSAATVTAGTVYLGGYAGLANATYAYQGFLDEFKIYNSPISAEQARMDYNGGGSLNLGVTSATESSQLADGPGNGPVAEWNFNEGTGQFTYDKSGNSATSYIGETSSVEATKDPDWVNGKVGGGLYFDGGYNVALVPYVSSLSLGNNLTLQAWIKPTTLTPGDQSIINKGTTSSWNNRAYSLMLALDEISISYLNGNGWQQFLTTNANLVADQWYHVAYTRDGSTEKIYLNGALIAQQAQTESMVDDTFELTIGAMIANSPGNEKFFGTIDEVKLYNYARSASQIAYDMNRGGPYVHYQFDECEGSTIYDNSGNADHGTWFGTTSGSQTAVGTCTTSSTAWGNGATGKINASLNFDGTNDYVALPDNILDVPTTGSICTWFYYDKASDDDTQGTLFSYADSGGVSYKHMFYISDSGADSALIRLAQRTNTTSNKIDYNTANGVVTRQTWQHVCIVQDGSGVDLYLNGNPVTFTPTLTGSVSLSDWFDDVGANCENATIGVIEDDSKDSYFTGKIDDFRIYTYPLTQTQIRKILQDGSSVKFGPSSGSP